MSLLVCEIVDSPYHKKELGYKAVMFYCPGCKESHTMDFNRWKFNHDMVKPALHLSFLTGNGSTRRCHLWVRDGELVFLSDCTHKLAGQTVKMEVI